MWMTLEHFPVSERSWTLKMTQSTSLFILNVESRKTHRDRKWVGGCCGAEENQRPLVDLSSGITSAASGSKQFIFLRRNNWLGSKLPARAHYPSPPVYFRWLEDLATGRNFPGALAGRCGHLSSLSKNVKGNCWPSTSSPHFQQAEVHACGAELPLNRLSRATDRPQAVLHRQLEGRTFLISLMTRESKLSTMRQPLAFKSTK